MTDQESIWLRAHVNALSHGLAKCMDRTEALVETVRGMSPELRDTYDGHLANQIKRHVDQASTGDDTSPLTSGQIRQLLLKILSE